MPSYVVDELVTLAVFRVGSVFLAEHYTPLTAVDPGKVDVGADRTGADVSQAEAVGQRQGLFVDRGGLPWAAIRTSGVP